MFRFCAKSLRDDMSRFWSPLVHDLKPYVAGEQPVMRDIVKLNTNENPYGPSPRALEAIRAEATDALRLYPEPTSIRLREAIAKREGVTAELDLQLYTRRLHRWRGEYGSEHAWNLILGQAVLAADQPLALDFMRASLLAE